jgi:cold shock CspA family protein
VGHDGELVTGTVLRWSDEDGWGVLTSDALDGTVFAHYSTIRDQAGWRGLRPGQPVAFTWEESGQDGCDHRAVDVYTDTSRTPVEPPPAEPGSSAYRSWLTIGFDPPS